jgi:hypothetical protein
MKVFLVIKRWFITLGKWKKIFHMFSNSIDCKILMQGGMITEKSFKLYSNDQWLWC